jgi:hypothetical protein
MKTEKRRVLRLFLRFAIWAKAEASCPEPAVAGGRE